MCTSNAGKINCASQVLWYLPCEARNQWVVKCEVWLAVGELAFFAIIFKVHHLDFTFQTSRVVTTLLVWLVSLLSYLRISPSPPLPLTTISPIIIQYSALVLLPRPAELYISSEIIGILESRHERSGDLGVRRSAYSVLDWAYYLSIGCCPLSIPCCDLELYR